jgi:hypothetical protein
MGARDRRRPLAPPLPARGGRRDAAPPELAAADPGSAWALVQATGPAPCPCPGCGLDHGRRVAADTRDGRVGKGRRPVLAGDGRAWCHWDRYAAAPETAEPWHAWWPRSATGGLDGAAVSSGIV